MEFLNPGVLCASAREIWKYVSVALITDFLNQQLRMAILVLVAKQEGIPRNHLILPSGRIRDSVVFRIIESHWADVESMVKLGRSES